MNHLVFKVLHHGRDVSRLTASFLACREKEDEREVIVRDISMHASNPQRQMVLSFPKSAVGDEDDVSSREAVAPALQYIQKRDADGLLSATVLVRPPDLRVPARAHVAHHGVDMALCDRSWC
jgi:hypothetical protein